MASIIGFIRNIGYSGVFVNLAESGISQEQATGLCGYKDIESGLVNYG